jgi:hypothetical protein
MASINDFPARGKVIQVRSDSIIFAPSNTNYELKLLIDSTYDGPVNTVVDVFIRVLARKIWTVSSGGNFIAPIQGPPRIVQGRIKYLDPKIMVIHAGLPVQVELPAADTAIDLNRGELAIGSLANAALMPGAKLLLAPLAVAT